LNYAEASIDLEAELADLEAILVSGNMSNVADLTPELEPEGAAPGNRNAMRLDEMSDSEEAYKKGVEEVRKEIIAGNLLQAVLSRRLTLYSDVRALEAYRKLRSANPSPYLFYLDFGIYQIFGSSPEVHVKAKAGLAVLRPIAGTRRRGASREEDFALESELLSDPKERAEHLMLVDLGRNDLGRVCVPGSVKVTDYMTVERYSHVMHIVSQVEGKLSEGKTGVDALRATFPAGTVSGAPKIRAIEILSRLEPQQRRFYAGAIGYMEPGGNIDTCIGIRCALKIGKQLVLQAGAGIVYDSTPERELEETREKMSAVLRAVGIDPSAAMQSDSTPAPAVRRSHRTMPDPDMTMSLGYSNAGAAPRSVESEKIQSKVDSIVEEKEYVDKIAGEEPDADDFDEFGLIAGSGETEVALGAPSDIGTEDFAAHETFAAHADLEITPLDWDWDPNDATGSEEIQSDIDDLFGNSMVEGERS
jgi:isochorismate synthase EntC